MNPKTTTALDTIPIISIEDCRKHLRVTPDDDSPPSHPDDGLILMRLAVAREWVEWYTGLALCPRTLELALDRFPYSEILLPIPPTISVTSVKYTDEAGVQQTIDPANYVLDTYQRPGWLLPASGYSWPKAKKVINAVVIRYVVGYSHRLDSEQVEPLPKMLQAAMLLLLGSLYENREDETSVKLEQVPLGVKSMCDWLKVRKGMA